MNFVIENLRVGDKVRIKKNGVEGYLYNIDCIEKRTLELESKEYEIEYVFSVISGTKVYTFLNENDFDLIEQTRTINDIKKEDLENAIQKFLKLSESIEKYASMGKYATDRKENVSNFEKMEQKTIEKRENEPLYERNERFAKILKKELERNAIILNESKPSLLTEDERVILRNLDNRYKWIARDSSDNLWLFENEPKKSVGGWYDGYVCCEGFYFFDHIFKFIKWKGGKPYNIEELLKGENKQ